MASLLEGKLKKIVAKAFHGKLKRGTIRQETGSTLDTFGDPVLSTPKSYSFEGIRETFDASYAARAGIPDTDVKILVLGSVKPTQVLPKQDDKIYIEAQWHQVRRILSIDPAGASMSLQCYEIEAP